jgi:hypothetical protein
MIIYVFVPKKMCFFAPGLGVNDHPDFVTASPEIFERCPMFIAEIVGHSYVFLGEKSRNHGGHRPAIIG